MLNADGMRCESNEESITKTLKNKLNRSKEENEKLKNKITSLESLLTFKENRLNELEKNNTKLQIKIEFLETKRKLFEILNA